MRDFRLLVLLMVVLLAGVGIYARALRLAKERGHGETAGGSPSVTPTPVPTPTPLASPSRSENAAAPSRAATGTASRWAAFRERFGRDLQAEFTARGDLASARGRAGEGSRAGTDYRSDDPQRASARAREIVDAARMLLGVQDTLPLGDPTVRAAAGSAQVTFKERSDGMPIEPFGVVTVDLGPAGELLALESTYVPDVHPENSRKLRAGEAAAAVLSDPQAGTASLKLEGGVPVVWVDRPVAVAGAPVPARYAFDFSYGGRRIVVDAADGKILARRDQRHY